MYGCIGAVNGGDIYTYIYIYIYIYKGTRCLRLCRVFVYGIDKTRLIWSKGMQDQHHVSRTVYSSPK